MPFSMGSVKQYEHVSLTSTAIVNYNDDDSCPISECLLCARNCVKCCKYVILFNSQNSPTKLLLFPFYSKGAMSQEDSTSCPGLQS